MLQAKTFNRQFLPIAAVLFVLLATPTYANIILSGTGNSSVSDPVSYKADLAISGNTLTVQLSNLSNESSAPSDLLSSFYFDIVKSGNVRPTLTYISAVGNVWLTHKSTADVLQTASANLMAVNPGDNTWEYHAMDPTQVPLYGFGIGTVGNSSLSPNNNFKGNIVGGFDYSIYAGDVTTQNLDNYLLVKSNAIFTFTGVTGFTEADIKTSCVFGEGTAPDGLLTGTVVPEPSTFVLLATGAISLIGYGWRRRASSISA